MKKKACSLVSLTITVFVCSVAEGHAQKAAKKPLTNADVVSMVKAGLAESTIVLAIQRAPTDFDTSPEALASLKNQGLTQKVLDAMLTAGAETTSPPEPGPQAAVNPRLAKIHRLFIKGNNEAAISQRKLLLERAKNIGTLESLRGLKPGALQCFALAANEKATDGVLETSQETAPDGGVTVSSTLADPEGNVLWSDSELDAKRPDYLNFIPQSQAGLAARTLMVRLMKQACSAEVMRDPSPEESRELMQKAKQ